MFQRQERCTDWRTRSHIAGLQSHSFGVCVCHSFAVSLLYTAAAAAANTVIYILCLLSNFLCLFNPQIFPVCHCRLDAVLCSCPLCSAVVIAGVRLFLSPCHTVYPASSVKALKQEDACNFLGK